MKNIVKKKINKLPQNHSLRTPQLSLSNLPLQR
jgi:hypothetical protein